MTERTAQMTNAQVFASCLKRHGVEYLFGQCNPSTITMACREMGIREIGYRQENAGVSMAQGYAMSSGRVPVVTAQNGPAATLLVPGLSECLKASHPVVAVVQQVARQNHHRNAFQELDHEKLFMGCAKWVGTILDPVRIEDYVDLAFRTAASGRPGPVVLLCPMDIFADRTPREFTLCRSADLGYYPLERPVADRGALQKAAKLLMEARNPVVYAGGGVKSSKAQEELRSLQERFSLPVTTTMMGKGAVDEGHPLSMGVSANLTGKRGMARYCRPLIAGADVILLVGNRTNQNGTDSWQLLPRNCSYIQIDVDPAEIGRNYEALGLSGDAGATLAALGEEMERLDGTRRREGRRTLEETIRAARRQHLEEIGDVTTGATRPPIRPERLMSVLDGMLDEDHIIVADASLSSIWVANYLSATARREFYLPRGIAGLGWGFPMAMGARLANPGRKVFCLCGDGGFAHVWSEVETMRREGMEVVCAVLNNRLLGYQYFAENARFGDSNTACDLGAIDHAQVAAACGCKGMRLEDPMALEAALREALDYPGGVILDVIADRSSIPPVPELIEGLAGREENIR